MEPLDLTLHNVPSEGRPAGEKSNGLARLAGTWSEEEYERFESAVAVTEQVDEDLWR